MSIPLPVLIVFAVNCALVITCFFAGKAKKYEWLMLVAMAAVPIWLFLSVGSYSGLFFREDVNARAYVSIYGFILFAIHVLAVPSLSKRFNGTTSVLHK